MNKKPIKVLLVDDDVLLGNTIVQELNERGYKASFLNSVYGVNEAILKIQPDIIIFDVEIGKDNGIELARSLYDGNPSLPIIFISSHHEESLKEKSLILAGAVAYLDKPFSIKFLSAHIDRFARMKVNSSNVFDNFFLKQVGNIMLDLKNRAIITENGIIIELRAMEFNILKALTEHFENTVSRNNICNAAWSGQMEYYNDQSLNNYIRRLRIILEDNTNLEINLVRGMGYRLETKS